MTILGLGHDVVDIRSFGEQLSEPGSRMRGLFSTRELRQAAMRSRVKHDEESDHLAGKWAGKEAVLKAWSQAVGSKEYPYSLDTFPWNNIEILDDSRSRPSVVLGEDVRHRCEQSVSTAGTFVNHGYDDMQQVVNKLNHGQAFSDSENIIETGQAVQQAVMSDNGGASVFQTDVAGSDTSSRINAYAENSSSYSVPQLVWHISLSHDGDIASAVVVLELLARV